MDIKKVTQDVQKFMGDAGKVTKNLVDVAETVGKSQGLVATANAVNNVAPIVATALDRQFEHEKSLQQLDNVVDMTVDEAKAFLEMCGFHAYTIVAPMERRFASMDVGTVVRMDPAPGKYKPATLVKLYYIDEVVKKKAKEQIQRDKENQEKFNKQVGETINGTAKFVGDVAVGTVDIAGKGIGGAAEVAGNVVQGAADVAGQGVKIAGDVIGKGIQDAGKAVDDLLKNVKLPKLW